ncbi:TonB-dependent receptor [Arcicella sp. LKC2W]|uniref:TonB-dependent receptor n=1 Tax=Arcicella sp. LKC2W TaxID=2984198 RepID=UPI002B1F854D|nr:TonB-dependent receptor [Arcicella sp. LKC2W]MEA5461102.1 TonB-dependent receptor [Arcicella sp. LKC2W]
MKTTQTTLQLTSLCILLFLVGTFQLLGATQTAISSNVKFIQNSISGKVSSQAGEPLIGVNISIKGTKRGTVTDKDGKYLLEGIIENSILVFSFIGYRTVERRIGDMNTLNIILEDDDTALEEVVITGVLDKRTRMEASVAITSIGAKQIERMAVNSSVDLLKNVPGVYVNTSRGEVNASVYTRGLNYGGGSAYISLQEDGLPIMANPGATATDPTLKADGFLRADATILKVEAVRGGTASILGANAPGGIFNYISKVGTTALSTEFRLKMGLEGNGKKPYYRGDFNVGGPLNKTKDLTFNVGGFYRYADGPKYPGYPLSRGGQIKANIVKNYRSGSLKLYTKFLDDRTAQFEQTPTIGFDNPQIVKGFDNTSSTLVQDVQFSILGTPFAGADINYNTRNVGRYADKAIGLNWEQTFGEGWTFNNNIRFSAKNNELNTTQIVFPFRVDQVTFYGVAGMAGKFGTYNFYNPATGASYGSVSQLPPTPTSGGIRFIPNNLNLPGIEVLQNALFYNPNPYTNIDLTEVIDQATISKKLKNMSLTAGVYYSTSTVTRVATVPSAQAFATVENQPKLVGIKYTNLAGQIFDFTDSKGIANYGAGGYYDNKATVDKLAFFVGHNWQIGSKVNFDWGIRYETFDISASFSTPKRGTDSQTGIDGNALTLYDNRIWSKNPTISYTKNASTVSYSAGMNYKMNDELAFYGRFSQGRKSPDLGLFLDFSNQNLAAELPVEAQSTQMLEFGLKVKKDKLNLFVTPFYTRLSNVPNFQVFQNTDGTYYGPPRVYEKFETTGLEIEANYNFSKRFSLRAVGIFQDSKATDFTVYLANANGSADDVKVDYSGNKTDNVAPVMFTITPTYNSDRFYTSLIFQYMGKRWANVANAFQLPDFSSLDFNAGYTISNHIQLSASINNLANTYGVMGWAAPGGFPAALDTQGFTKEMLNKNPNGIYSTLGILPRAYFLTLSYKF